MPGVGTVGMGMAGVVIVGMGGPAGMVGTVGIAGMVGTVGIAGGTGCGGRRAARAACCVLNSASLTAITLCLRLYSGE